MRCVYSAVRFEYLDIIRSNFRFDRIYPNTESKIEMMVMKCFFWSISDLLNPAVIAILENACGKLCFND